MKSSHCGGEAPVLAPVPRWRREEDGTIHFSVTSDGTTGVKWISCFDQRGDHVGDYAESVLCSDDFKPTRRVTTKVVVLPSSFWSDDNRTAENICAKAKKLKLDKPNAEVACLIREQFTDEELAAMGFRFCWLIVMHTPIKDSRGAPRFLGVFRGDSGWLLDACYYAPLRRWNRDRAFAFAVPQVSA